MKHILTCTFIFLAILSQGQTNNFPLFSNGAYSGGSGDYTNIISPQLKLQSSAEYIRVPHLSSHSSISTVYNYETGKYVYWGEPADAGQYLFRGRDLIVEQGKLGIGTNSPRGQLDVAGTGDIYLVNNPVAGTAQSAYLPGHIYVSTYAGTDWSYFQARRSDNSGSTNFRFRTYNSGSLTEAMSILSNGNVGIGTTAPQAQLEVSTSSKFGIPLKLNKVSDNWGTDNSAIWINCSGPNCNYATPISDLGVIRIDGFGTIGTAINSNNNFIVKLDGKVGIGNTNPDAMLAVKGQIHAQEVKVDLNVPGPDYVFEKDYKLTSLEEIKNYIDQNKHLPEVPSAKEMEKNGVQLGEMNMLLLKKIEELTLYVIELKKENAEAKQQIKIMQSEINKLKK